MKLYIDEAGRWPLAWPLHVWVVLPLKNFDKTNFRDSKKLSEAQREKYFFEIENLQKDWKIRYWIWTVTNTEIDKLWVTKSINLAIRRGISQIIDWIEDVDKRWEKFLKIKKWISKKDIEWFDLELIIDWNTTFWLDKDLWIKVQTVIKWDDKIKEISMASILAKVSRDRIMKTEMDEKYPKYNFSKHKWYGTKEHRDAILKYWPCKIHRKLFLRKMNIDKNS